MKNRYGEEYDFIPVNENTYQFKFETKYCRYGGLPDTNSIDSNNLGFVDPSGGPFVSPGFDIKGRKVTKIYISEEKKILLEVE